MKTKTRNARRAGGTAAESRRAFMRQAVLGGAGATAAALGAGRAAGAAEEDATVKLGAEVQGGGVVKEGETLQAGEIRAALQERRGTKVRPAVRPAGRGRSSERHDRAGGIGR